MVKYLSFHNSSFALRWFLILMARPQCDTILVKSWSKIAQISLLEICSLVKIDFCIVNFVSDNYWSKCTGTNCLSLVELTFLMCGDIEH
jgi:hypothetical protein